MIGIFVVIIIVIVLIWFNIPYSPTKNKFKKDVESIGSKNKIETEGDVFKEEDFEKLPVTIQKYIKECGYIGKPRMSHLKMEYKDVDFSQGKNGPKLKIDYTQYNFVKEPSRMAFIDSSMFGIPFEGYDYYQDGVGGMKGVIAKSITLFDQRGPEMDKACLATYLAECLFAPSILLQDYITFEELSEHEVKAVISYKGQTVSGIFRFNEQNEMISFTTNDRAVVGNDGSINYVPWSALCNEYQMSDCAIKYPTKFKAVWNYEDGDFVYFDGVINRVSYLY